MCFTIDPRVKAPKKRIAFKVVYTPFIIGSSDYDYLSEHKRFAYKRGKTYSLPEGFTSSVCGSAREGFYVFLSRREARAHRGTDGGVVIRVQVHPKDFLHGGLSNNKEKVATYKRIKVLGSR
jgi:hypothetical protein